MGYRNFSGALLPETNQAGVRYVKGTWSSETIYGSDGPDEFEGGGGRDTFVGGGGDDYYWVRDTRDVVQEWAGGGIDTIRIWSSYTLPANVENLIVFGDKSYAAGNDQDNIIQGLDGSQFIYGGRGEDVLLGGGGADTFVVVKGEGNKVIQDFQSWSDKLRLIGGNLTSFNAVKSAMTQQGSDVVLNDGGTQILFRNANIGQFTEQDFQLPLDPRALGAPTFVDEFNNLQTGSVWRTNYGYAGDGLNSFTLPRNGEMQIYVAPEFKGTTGAPLGLNPYNISNGVLTINAQPATADLAGKMWGYQYTSGMLLSHHTQTYGYFEIRAELPKGQGLWPAFWLLGENNNEIDILEALGSDTKVPHNALHSNAYHGGVHNFIPSGDGFHTYGALWTPTNIIFYIDGTEAWRVATPSDMNKPMFMILNLAIGGPWAGAPDGTTPWPAQMKIDYVKAWALPGSSPTSPPPPPPSEPPPPTSGSGVHLTSKAYGDVMTGGSGADTLTAGNGGEQMTGGAGADVIQFTRVPWSPTQVKDFQVGVDKLDIAALLKGYTGDPVAGGRLYVESDGAGGAKVVVDGDGPGGAWGDFVVHLHGVSTAGLDPNALLGGAPPPPPSGGGGAGQTLTSPAFGAVMTGGAGADVLIAGNGAEQMTGGGGGDVFQFVRVPWSPSEIRDFQVGVDKLDITALLKGYTGDPVAGGRLYLDSDGAGGTKVVVDGDGPGGAWGDYVAHLQGVSPVGLTSATLLGVAGAPASQPPATGGGSTGVVLTSGFAGDKLTGGSGADTLNASRGSDTLTGGAGNDRFVFSDVPWSPADITDFQDGDVLDLRGVFARTGYSGADPVADRYLGFISDGAGGTKVLFDSDGAASGQLWPSYILHLPGVAPESLSASDWIIR